MIKEIGENIFLRLESSVNKQILFFFGAKHTNNVSDSQFKRIEDIWTEFLKTPKNKKIVFSERNLDSTIPETYEDSIKKYGEIGAIHWLAKKSEIEISCPEPNEKEQRKMLCNLFDKEIVAYSMIAQNLAAWFQHARQSNFSQAIVRSISREAKFEDIYNFEPSEEWFKNQHKKLFGEQKLENEDFLRSITDPRNNKTLINNVISSKTKIRNEFILSKIMESWNLGKDIFIVYGKGHLDSLKEPLTNLIKN